MALLHVEIAAFHLAAEGYFSSQPSTVTRLCSSPSCPIPKKVDTRDPEALANTSPRRGIIRPGILPEDGYYPLRCSLELGLSSPPKAGRPRSTCPIINTFVYPILFHRDSYFTTSPAGKRASFTALLANLSAPRFWALVI